ncbi:Trm112 family protein [Actinomadura sp. DC4]|uniref:Trm112 family protein n=1 Tax=Actinomadura sp. DC4 TaxID=3055069 RepID=UPI0025B03C77|nr:Trm112 family protein [Actinomadura sp. DC4]MDN3355665.1 hypothetical protein [Actinomadura sp. DC4]
MPLDDRLLRLLACPIDKEALLHFPDDGMLYNPRLRRRYRVETGIPVLLADQAESTSDELHETLVARAGRGEALASLGRDPVELVKGDVTEAE